MGAYENKAKKVFHHYARLGHPYEQQNVQLIRQYGHGVAIRHRDEVTKGKEFTPENVWISGTRTRAIEHSVLTYISN